jgi:hypothetical protein
MNSEVAEVDAVREYRRAYYIKHKEHIKAKSRAWAAENKERKAVVDKSYRAKNQERCAANARAWVAANPEKRAEIWRRYRAEKLDKARESEAAYRARNREVCNERIREWKARNPHKITHYFHKRRAAELSATPAWADLDAIEAIYAESQRMQAETGVPHHVDHIVPLISKYVCGLHCEANLRVLPAIDNVKKGNRQWPGMLEWIAP